MKKTSNDRITYYFTKILTGLNWENRILKFPDLITIYKDEPVSVEHIFLLLHKKGYIGSHNENIRLIQSNLEAGIPTSFNDLRFHVVHDEAIKFITKGNNKDLKVAYLNPNQTILKL